MCADIIHDHSTQAIRDRLEQGNEASYLRDWIYGGIDGAVTTFAIVSSVIGADLSTKIILILGAANIFADGFSMAASNYTGTKAENEEFDRIRAYEERQIDRNREGEVREIREIYRAKGFDGNDLDRAVEIITSDRKLWVDTMMTEEYGLRCVSIMRVDTAPAVSGNALSDIEADSEHPVCRIDRCDLFRDRFGQGAVVPDGVVAVRD